MTVSYFMHLSFLARSYRVEDESGVYSFCVKHAFFVLSAASRSAPLRPLGVVVVARLRRRRRGRDERLGCVGAAAAEVHPRDAAEVAAAEARQPTVETNGDDDDDVEEEVAAVEAR